MKLLSSPLRPALAATVLLAGAAGAEAPAVPQDTAPEAAPRNYVNLRVGVASTTRQPVVCLELAPLELLSLEACGAGSEYRPASATASVSHYLVFLKLDSWKKQVGWLQGRLGAGIAEVQVGPDKGGFQFTGVGPDGVETAGPELAGSLRLLVPVVGGLEAVGEFRGTLAYFYHAPKLLHPRSKWEPGIALTVGVGF
ncbi:MAG TPA: hypothetical protein VF815_36770 [Myxococcaceae bacterium]|jgi:hypothetical protein